MESKVALICRRGSADPLSATLPITPAVRFDPSSASPDALYHLYPDLDGVIFSSPDLQNAYLALGYGKHILLPPTKARPDDLYRLASLSVKKELLLIPFTVPSDAASFLTRMVEQTSPAASIASVRAYYTACGFSDDEIPSIFAY